MADEFNNANANNGQLPDDLTQILNDANPENIMPENLASHKYGRCAYTARWRAR